MGFTKSAQRHRARQLGHAWAESMYRDFQDPKLRGKKFKWKYFPDLVARLARVNCFTAFPHGIGEDVKEVAAEAGRARAQQLLKPRRAKPEVDEPTGDEPLVMISVRMPQAVIDELKTLAPQLGFPGYQALLKSYVQAGLRRQARRAQKTD